MNSDSDEDRQLSFTENPYHAVKYVIYIDAEKELTDGIVIGPVRLESRVE
jgi:hypothetical protein